MWLCRRIAAGEGQGRRWRQDGLDGLGAREGHHDSVGGDALHVGRSRRQFHRFVCRAVSTSHCVVVVSVSLLICAVSFRHARSRRFYDRSRARVARARRRDSRHVRRQRRAESNDHRRSSDEAVMCPRALLFRPMSVNESILQLQRAAHHLCQQARSARRQSSSRHSTAQGEAQIGLLALYNCFFFVS